MRIIIVDTTIHKSIIGGAQTFLPSLINGLTDKGHEVHLVAEGVPDERVRKQLSDSGVILHTRIWKRNSLVFDSTPVLAAWVNSMSPDIYLISVSPDIGWTVLPYLNSSIATLTIGHTDSETFYLPARHYQPFLTRVIGVSDAVCENYISDCKFPMNAVEWIPYGVIVNTEEPVDHRSDPILQLIYVGRIIEEQKRVSDLIKIAHQLSKHKISFCLKIIGDGPEMSELKKGLMEEIRSGQVKIFGWLQTQEVVNHLQQSDIFLLTSAYEGFCIALVEAMANGCCPLVTNIKSGNKQLIENGQNGFIFSIGDTQGFVEKIIELELNKTAISSLRKKAWMTGKYYSTERMVKTYERCFKDAIIYSSRNPREPDHAFPFMSTCRSKYPLWARRIKAFFT